MKRALLYGFGGHGRVLAELLLESGFHEIGVFDDNEVDTSAYTNIKYLGKYDSTVFPNTEILIALGNNELRSQIAAKIKHPFLTFIHPSAYVSSSCKIEEGTVVLQNAVIQSNVVIGKHCIVNIQASIDHDTQIADFNHIAPHVYVGSNSNIPPLSEINPSQTFPRFSKL